jgi:small subunit ribosomal protein S20
MAKNLSAVKRVQIASRNNQSNKKYKSVIKTVTKKILAEIEISSSRASDSDNSKLQLMVSQAYSKIDKAVKKGVIHKNSAARKKSRLVNIMRAS